MSSVLFNELCMNSSSWFPRWTKVQWCHLADHINQQLCLRQSFTLLLVLLLLGTRKRGLLRSTLWLFVKLSGNIYIHRAPCAWRSVVWLTAQKIRRRHWTCDGKVVGLNPSLDSNPHIWLVTALTVVHWWCCTHSTTSPHFKSNRTELATDGFTSSSLYHAKRNLCNKSNLYNTDQTSFDYQAICSQTICMTTDSATELFGPVYAYSFEYWAICTPIARSM